MITCQICNAEYPDTHIIEMCDPCYLKSLHSRWISIKDRLPGSQSEFIVATNNGFVTAISFSPAINGFKEPTWHHKPEETGGYWNRCITHWMLLPKLPKEE